MRPPSSGGMGSTLRTARFAESSPAKRSSPVIPIDSAADETLTAIPYGRVWTDQQWLAHLLFYGLDRAGGLGLVAAFHALMVAGALGVITGAINDQGGSGLNCFDKEPGDFRVIV